MNLNQVNNLIKAFGSAKFELKGLEVLALSQAISALNKYRLELEDIFIAEKATNAKKGNKTNAKKGNKTNSKKGNKTNANN